MLMLVFASLVSRRVINACACSCVASEDMYFMLVLLNVGEYPPFRLVFTDDDSTSTITKHSIPTDQPSLAMPA